MGACDLRAHRKTKSGPLSLSLGGEERIEDLLAQALWDSAAGILHTQQNVRAVTARRHFDAMLVRRPVLNGLRSVHQQVGDHLTDLSCVGCDHRELVEIQHEHGAMPNKVPGDLGAVSHELIAVHAAHVRRFQASHFQELLGDTLDPPHAFVAILQPLPRLRIPDGNLLQESEVEHHVGYGVVDFVGHTRRKLADRREPLTMQNLSLRPGKILLTLEERCLVTNDGDVELS